MDNDRTRDLAVLRASVRRPAEFLAGRSRTFSYIFLPMLISSPIEDANLEM